MKKLREISLTKRLEFFSKPILKKFFKKKKRKKFSKRKTKKKTQNETNSPKAKCVIQKMRKEKNFSFDNYYFKKEIISPF